MIWTFTPVATLCFPALVSAFNKAKSLALFRSAGKATRSKTKKLKLDTGDLVYDNYVDKDLSIAVSASLSIDPKNLAAWRGSASAQYKNVTGITFATLGDGAVTIRNRPNLDYSALNADPANMQRITKSTSFSIDVPELNLAALSKDIADSRNFMNTLTANIPTEIRKKGKAATDYYEDFLLNGASNKVLREFVSSGMFETSLNLRNAVLRLLQDRHDLRVGKS